MNLTSEKEYFSEKVTQVKLLRGKNTHKYEINYSSDEYIQTQYKQNIVNSNYENQYFVCQQITGTTDKFRIHLALTDKYNFLFGNSVNKFKLNESKNNKVVLSVINSSVIDWYFRKTSTNNHVNGYELEQLPIKIPTNQQPFITLVDQILSAKKQGQDTAALEQQIDVMVYHLYELSYDEACVIDNGLSLEDFERYKI